MPAMQSYVKKSTQSTNKNNVISFQNIEIPAIKLYQRWMCKS